MIVETKYGGQFSRQDSRSIKVRVTSRPASVDIISNWTSIHTTELEMKGKKSSKVIPFKQNFQVLQKIRPIMQFLRIWPDEMCSTGVLWFLVIFTTLPNIFYISSLRDDPLDLIFAFSQFCNLFTHNGKLFYFYYRRKALLQLIEGLESCLQAALQENLSKWDIADLKMKKNLRIMENLYKLFYFLLGMLATIPLVLSSFKVYILGHNTRIEQSIRVNYFGYGSHTDSLDLGHLIGTIGTYIHCCVILTLGIIPPYIIYCVAEYFHFVQLRFEAWNASIMSQSRYEKAVNKELNLKKLGEVVDDHCSALSLYKDLRIFLSPVLLFDIFPAIFLMCTISFSITMFNSNGTFVLLFILSVLTIILTTFFLSYFSTQLMTNNSNIARTVGDFDWYNHPISMRREFVLIMVIAQKERCITAGYFYPVSLESFTVFMSTSFSYFTVVQEIYSLRNSD